MNYKKNITSLLSSFLLFFHASLFSQRVIEIRYEQDGKGNYQFYCNNNAWCSYILKVNVTGLRNAKPDCILPYHAAVKPGNNKLFKLLKENPNDSIGFKYSVSYSKGCIRPVIDSGFVYLLPIAPGKEAQSYELTNPGKADEGPEHKNWYLIRLRMKPGDTLFAARRGIVSEVETGSGLNDAGVASAGDENYIEINHADCSFGRYGIVKKNGSFVKPGQQVEAGMPIGLVGGDKYGRGSDARFSVFYNLEDSSSNADPAAEKTYRLYIPLLFWTKNNGKGKLQHGASYTSEFPKAILRQEMTRPPVKKSKAKPKRS